MKTEVKEVERIKLAGDEEADSAGDRRPDDLPRLMVVKTEVMEVERIKLAGR